MSAEPRRGSPAVPLEATLSIAVEPALLASILVPYKPHCRYVSSARVGSMVPSSEQPVAGRHAMRAPLAWIEGELSIPDSCYIDDTGHFNSVEFNLCYNQLVYVLMAQCVASKLLAPFAAMTLEEYRRRQLPDVLIHDFHSVFKKPLNPRGFRGRVLIEEAFDRRRFILVKTSCGFEDDQGGRAEGSVSLAIVNRQAGDPQGNGVHGDATL